MIFGAHSLIYSRDAEADRAFLRDVLGLPHVDAGEGWLIFGLPPSEVAVHPAERNDVHELYLLCDDVQALAAQLQDRGIACTAFEDHGWGLLTRVALPGGGTVGIYEPKHVRPEMSGQAAGLAAAAAAARPAPAGRTRVKAAVKAAASRSAALGRKAGAAKAAKRPVKSGKSVKAAKAGKLAKAAKAARAAKAAKPAKAAKRAPKATAKRAAKRALRRAAGPGRSKQTPRKTGR